MDEKVHKRYNKPSDAECFILNQFLNKIYLDRDANNRYSLFKSFIIPPDDRFRLPNVWTNTPKELHEQYERECPAEKGFGKCTESNIRKILKKLEDEGIIHKTESNERVYAESKYYPVETSDGFLALIRHVEEDYRHGFYPDKRFGLDPLYSMYSDMVLNRQFILDSLRKKMKCIRILKDGKLLDLPLLGRYIKNYELGPRIEEMMKTLEEVRNIIADEKETDYRKARDLLLKTNEPLPESYDKDYYMLTPEKRKSNLAYIGRLMEGLIEAQKQLESQRELLDVRQHVNSSEVSSKRDAHVMKRFSDKNTEGYAQHLDSMSPEHNHLIVNDVEINGLHWYGQEATWVDPVFTDEEEKVLSNIDKEIADEYAVRLNDKIVMPLLCLAQSSPSALFNIAYPENCRNEDGIYGFSSNSNHRPFAIRSTGVVTREVLGFNLGPKAFNDFLGLLCKCAIGDYITGNIRIRERYQHNEMTKTQLMTFGYSGIITAEESNSYAVPALFTFKVFNDYTTSIMFSDSPYYDTRWDVRGTPNNHPRPMVFDWSPAVAECECHVDSPSTWILEMHNYIMSSFCETDSCLHYLIKQALLKGML